MIRILSDLHLGYPNCRVQSVDQLAPLMEDVKAIVFNGDTAELRFLQERAQLDALCREFRVEPVFLTGNHDPTISENHCLELADGAVFVTHGDILFHGFFPQSTEVGQACREELEALGPDADLLLRLQASRRAVKILEPLGLYPGFWKALAPHLWPPWRLLHILSIWMRAPSLINELVERDVPYARCILTGHTHYSGVWRRGGRLIVNTGGFVPMSRPLVAELDGNMLTVRRIMSAHNQFWPGRIVTRREI